MPEEDRIYYQEVGFVLPDDRLLTVRKTPPGGAPFDIEPARAVCDARERPAAGHGRVPPRRRGRRDAISTCSTRSSDEIDELEEQVGTWQPPHVQRHLAGLRHDLLDIRRVARADARRRPRRSSTDGPTSKAAPVFRREVFPREVELYFASVYDKLLRASESLDFARDLLAAVAGVPPDASSRTTRTRRQDAHGDRVARALPTFIVGVYGQNFDNIPELHWGHGYAFSWGLIVASTIVQLAFFRWRRWI